MKAENRDLNQKHLAGGPSAPAAVAAERALVGILLTYPHAADELGDLRGKHFYEPIHGRVVDAVLARRARGLTTDSTVLDGLFIGDSAYQESGALGWLESLIETAPGPSKAETYAREVREAARRRELLELADDIRTDAQETDDATKVIASASRRLGEIEMGAFGDHWLSAGEAVSQAVQHAQTRKGAIEFPIGVKSLDAVLGGLHAGEVTLLGGRPGMGKSVAGLAIARANASAGLGTGLFSLEMTADAVGMRLACDVAYPFDKPAVAFAGVPSRPTFDKAMKGDLNDWGLIIEAQDIIARWPLVIDDRSGLTVASIEAAVRRQHRVWKQKGVRPGPVIIDHIGKIRPAIDRKGSKHAEMADVSNDLQAMAKRLEVPVIGLVQLNRGVEGRDDKRPQLSDLRQAGELEEDARQVIFLYRPEYYLRDGPPDESFDAKVTREQKLEKAKNQLFWIIEKNSHGPRAQVRTFVEIACSAIREFAS